MSKRFDALTGSQAGCRVCDQVFANVTLFDQHRSEYYIRKDELVGSCNSGQAYGWTLVNGVWYDEAGLRMLAKAAAARSTKASFKLEHGDQ